ncbi:hypothetical protein V6Z11_D05G079900 [Gossypium hirsutum]
MLNIIPTSDTIKMLNLFRARDHFIFRIGVCNSK